MTVRPFARAIKNPDNPEFDAEDLLHKVTGEEPVVLKAAEETTMTTSAPPASEPKVRVVKHSRLSVYLTPEEHWFVRDKAHERRMSLNDYVRSVLLAGR